MHKTVLIATDKDHPDLYWDERPLLAELRSRGLSAIPAAWTDDNVEWAGADLVLVRNCWDAYVDPSRFLEWLDRVALVTTVVNDPHVIRWCYRKTYLRELEGKGVAIVPTRWISKDNPQDLTALLYDTGWSNALVKPSISGDGYSTFAIDASDASSVERAQRAVESLLQDRDVLLQPYFSEFDDNMETSLSFIGARFSHAYRRPSLLLHGEKDALAQRTVVQPAGAVLALAEHVLSLIPPVMWARVDILQADTPMLNELELVDPNLLMSFSPDGVAYRWMADAVEQRLGE